VTAIVVATSLEECAGSMKSLSCNCDSLGNLHSWDSRYTSGPRHNTITSLAISRRHLLLHDANPIVHIRSLPGEESDKLQVAAWYLEIGSEQDTIGILASNDGWLY
jgi:hypothetical protein